MRTFLKIWTIIALSFFPIYLFSQTEIAGGEVSGVWTKAKSPYRINGDITIPDGKTLEIKPGVRVEFTGYYKMNVPGRLLALGNEIDSIWFTSSGESKKWCGIKLRGSDSSKLSRCIFSNSTILSTDKDQYGSALFIANPSTKVDYCHFFKNTSDAGVVALWSSALVVSNVFTGNDGLIFHLHKSDSPQIINNVIINNNAHPIHSGPGFYGIICNNLICNNNGSISIDPNNDLSEPLIIGNTICNNNSALFFDCQKIRFYNNIIWGNKEYQIEFGENVSGGIYFENNIIQGGQEAFRGKDTKEIIFLNNTSSDPNFVSPTTIAGYTSITKISDWMLKQKSPSINNGKLYTDDYYNLKDIYNNPRISDGRVDIGAFEYQNASGNLKADLKADILTTIEIPATIQFSDLSSGIPTSWEWDFGDGTISRVQNPIQEYKQPGIYTVSLTARYSNNVSTSTQQNYLRIGKILETDGGNISGTWDYHLIRVNGDIIIPDKQTLEIKPGTTIEFQGYYRLLVKGRLLAIGLERDSIYFTTKNQLKSWHGIRFDNTSEINDSSRIKYCVIENGEARGIENDQNGGGIFINNFSKVIISNSLIVDNVANNMGGGICCINSNPIISGNIINANFSNGGNDGRGAGGGICCINSNPLILGNTFYNNYGDGGGICCREHANAKIIGNIVYKNNSSNAGGIFCSTADPLIQNNMIINNNASRGGAMFCNCNSYPSLINNIICNNTCGEAIIWMDTESNLKISNNTIAFNHSTNGSTIYLWKQCSPIFINNILYQNTTNDILNKVNLEDQNCNPKFNFNIIEGGLSIFTGNGLNSYNTSIDFFKNNIDVIPKFIKSPIGSGLNYDALNAVWSVQITSPCINAGNPDTAGLNLPLKDFYGNLRIANDRVDIGAYECQVNDLTVSSWLSKTNSCKFTDNETIKIRIKNYGLNPQSNFTVYYSSNGGISYIAENVLSTIKSGDSLDYSFIGTADLKSIRTYHCIIFVSSQSDYFLPNDTLKMDVISYSLSSGLKAKYDFCEGITDTIQASPGMVSYQWTGGVSSTNYLTINKSGIYSVKVINNEGCVAEENTNVTFQLPPASPSGSDKLTCEGALVASLTAIGTNIKWYNDSKLNKLIAEGNSYSPNITVQGIYPFYITQTEPAYGCTSLPSTIKLTINPRPSPPLSDDVYIGLGDATKSLTATGTNIQWYSKPDGTGLLHNGDTYNPNKTDLGIYEYYVTQTIEGCESSTKKVSLYILDIPAPPKTNDKTICRGRGNSKLQAEGVNVKWYNDKDLKNIVGTGSEFDLGETNAGEYIYYVTQTVNNVLGAIGTVKLTIIDVPYAPEVENVTIFKGEDPRPLLATGQDIKWYTDEALTNKVFEGTEFSTGKTDAGTYTYFVTQTVNGCESPARLVEYTLTETLNQIFTNVCEGDESIIEAPGQNVKWYADEARTSLLASGNKFSTGKTTPGDYTFYYTQTVNNTESNPAKAVLTIHPLPPKPEIMETNSSFCYEDIVKCTNFDKQYSYNWYLDETPIAGETGSEYELKKDLRGILKLVVTDLNTKCLNSSKEFSVSSFIPEIVLKGDNILICKNLTNDYKAWQWFRDNQKIENATYQFYEAKQPGEYFTEATNTIKCNLKSNKISLSQVASINLYPTINNGNFNLEIQNAKTEQLSLKVYNIFGLKVNEMEIEMMAEKTVMPVSLKGIQPGIYMIEMTFGNNRFMRRMVVE